MKFSFVAVLTIASSASAFTSIGNTKNHAFSPLRVISDAPLETFTKTDKKTQAPMSSNKKATKKPAPGVLINENFSGEADAVFDSIDKNNDGAISIDELRSHLEFISSTKSIVNLFHSLDSNDDGVITRDEWRIAFSRSKEVSKKAPVPVDINLDFQGNTDTVFDTIDTNKDGSISNDELRMYLEVRGYSPQSVQDLFITLDKDGDGLITKEEMKYAFSNNLSTKTNKRPPVVINKDYGGDVDSVFDSIDVNSDGSISYDELRTYLEGSGYSSLSMTNLFTSLDTNTDGEISREEFKIAFTKNDIKSEKEAEEPKISKEENILTKTLTTDDIADKNSIGVNSDFGGNPDTIFAAIDKNSDGSISRKELSKYLKSSGFPYKSVKNLFLMLDKNGDGVITLEEMRDAFASKAATEKQTEAAVDETMDDILALIDEEILSPSKKDRSVAINTDFLGDPDKVFDAIDKNSDGSISKKELSRYLQSSGFSYDSIKELFVALDKNGDGVITRDEMKLAFSNKAEIEDNKNGIASKDILAFSDMLFDSIDVNGDGEISNDELRAHLEGIGYSNRSIRNLFTAMDKNADGVISRDEMRFAFSNYELTALYKAFGADGSDVSADAYNEAVEQIRTNAQVGSNDTPLMRTILADLIFDMIDTDGSGEIDTAELKEHLMKNGDPAELQLGRDAFALSVDSILKALDLNSDGVISREEMRDGFEQYDPKVLSKALGLSATRTQEV